MLKLHSGKAILWKVTQKIRGVKKQAPFLVSNATNSCKTTI